MNILKKSICSCTCIICCLYVFSQTAKKPTIMILPSDNWCTQRYFTQTFEDQGRVVRIPDYQRAFQEDAEIGPVISRIGQILTTKGYSLKDCEQEIKSLSTKNTEDIVTTSSTGGVINESPLDVLKRKVKSDVIIQIGWQTKKSGSDWIVSFTIEAFDSFTNKRISTSTGSKIGNTNIALLLENAINDYIDEFDYQMIDWYQGILNNGREISFKVLCWDTWSENLESEINGTELLESILLWMHDNTVKSTYNLTDATETFAQFEQVRIPLFDKRGMALDARGFASMLRKYMSESFQIPSKIIYRGLGESYLILGDK